MSLEQSECLTDISDFSNLFGLPVLYPRAHAEAEVPESTASGSTLSEGGSPYTDLGLPNDFAPSVSGSVWDNTQPTSSTLIRSADIEAPQCIAPKPVSVASVFFSQNNTYELPDLKIHKFNENVNNHYAYTTPNGQKRKYDDLFGGEYEASWSTRPNDSSSQYPCLDVPSRIQTTSRPSSAQTQVNLFAASETTLPRDQSHRQLPTSSFNPELPLFFNSQFNVAQQAPTSYPTSDTSASSPSPSSSHNHSLLWKNNPALPPLTPPPPPREYKCEAANFLPPRTRNVCKALRFASAEEADRHLVRVHLQCCITCLLCGEKLSLIEDVLEHFKQKVACGEKLIESVELAQNARQSRANTVTDSGSGTTIATTVQSDLSANADVSTCNPDSITTVKTRKWLKPIFHLGKVLLEHRTRSAQKLVLKVRAANGDAELGSDGESPGLSAGSLQHIRAQVLADMIEEWFWYENRNAYLSKNPDFPGKLVWLRKGGPFAPYIKVLRPYYWPNHMFYEVHSLNIGIAETTRMVGSECGYFPPTVALAIHFWQSQTRTRT